MAEKSIQKKRDEMASMRTLRSVLVSSIIIEEPIKLENVQLPSIKEFVMDELINGTLAYVGRNGGGVKYSRSRLDNMFERKMADYFEREMTLAKKRLDPGIDADIRELVDTHWESDCCGESGPENLLFSYFVNCICTNLGRSTFETPYSEIQNIRSKILPSLPAAERRDIEGIGTAMRPFIREDLKFIWKTYHW